MQGHAFGCGDRDTEPLEDAALLPGLLDGEGFEKFDFEGLLLRALLLRRVRDRLLRRFFSGCAKAKGKASSTLLMPDISGRPEAPYMPGTAAIAGFAQKPVWRPQSAQVLQPLHTPL
mmetsp:Transcript_86554/g.245458  ORF Transcript_86554/g.245458 Transcript_86554/m.245458 type:complete len:117 (+) Transcript_86554:260-610(+)